MACPPERERARPESPGQATPVLPSSRILNTDDPIVAQMRRLVQSVEGTASSITRRLQRPWRG
jgi:hypothetical protein